MYMLSAAPELRQKMAQSFLGYFPTWEMFARDIKTRRDPTDPIARREEGLVLTAIDMLADLVGRQHDDLRGQYYAVQADSPVSQPAADDLIRCYDLVSQIYKVARAA